MNKSQYFNSLAEKWDEMTTHNKSRIMHILTAAQIQKGSKVLDVGTGTGILTPFLHSFIGDSGSIIAIDYAEKMIEVAKRKYNYENVQFIIGDVLEVKFQDHYFDCVICYSMFPHFEDKQKAIHCLSRYLKIGGRFVIGHSESRETINNLHKKASKYVDKDILPPAETIKKYFIEAGLETNMVQDDEIFVVIGIKNLLPDPHLLPIHEPYLLRTP